MSHFSKLVKNMSLKVLSIASHYFFPSFWQYMNSTSEKRHVFCFWHLHKNRSAAQPGHVSLNGTSDNRKGQSLVNTADGVRLPFSVFPSRFPPVLQHMAERAPFFLLFSAQTHQLQSIAIFYYDFVQFKPPNAEKKLGTEFQSIHPECGRT